MIRRIVMILVVCFVGGAEPPKEDSPKKDAEQLQGKWAVVSFEVTYGYVPW